MAGAWKEMNFKFPSRQNQSVMAQGWWSMFYWKPWLGISDCWQKDGETSWCREPVGQRQVLGLQICYLWAKQATIRAEGRQPSVVLIISLSLSLALTLREALWEHKGSSVVLSLLTSPVCGLWLAKPLTSYSFMFFLFPPVLMLSCSHLSCVLNKRPLQYEMIKGLGEHRPIKNIWRARGEWWVEFKGFFKLLNSCLDFWCHQ